MLKLRPAFEEESKAAVVDGVLDTPVSRIRLDPGTQARLSSSMRMTDAAGTPVFRVRGFALFKAGFWTMQNLAVYVGCGSEAAYSRVDGTNFAMNDGDDEGDEHYVDISAPESAIPPACPRRRRPPGGDHDRHAPNLHPPMASEEGWNAVPGGPDPPERIAHREVITGTRRGGHRVAPVPG